MSNSNLHTVGKRKEDPVFNYACGQHCKICPFPGYKCDGRRLQYNKENLSSPFARLYSGDNSSAEAHNDTIKEIKKEAPVDVNQSNQNL